MSATDPYWRREASFGLLADILASDRAFALAGAGVSVGMSARTGTKLPNWIGLLRASLARLSSRLAPDAKENVELLLQGNPRTSDLIEAASLLAEQDRAAFRAEIVRATEVDDSEATDRHRAICGLGLKGIVTFNYDAGFENALRMAGKTFERLVPTGDLHEQKEEAFRQWLQDQSKLALVKAHGTTDDVSSIVITKEDYRDAIAKNPLYRAFFANLVTNYSLVIVGFGMSDPDFDDLMDTMALSFGKPIREHVLVRGPQAADDATRLMDQKDELLFRQRYGVHVLRVQSWGDLPDMLSDAVTQSGPALERHLNLAFSKVRQNREDAHHHLRELGWVGQRRAASVLIERGRAALAARDWFVLAEAAYSLGGLRRGDSQQIKAFLFEVMRDVPRRRVVAQATIACVDLLALDDAPVLQEILARLPTRAWDTDDDDPDNRVPTYLEYALKKVRAKHTTPDAPA